MSDADLVLLFNDTRNTFLFMLESLLYYSSGSLLSYFTYYL